MRKFLLASLVAASAAFAGCQDNIDAPVASLQDEGSVQFSTYVGRGASRAAVVNTDNLNAFGVFGYMGGTSGFDPSSSTPDFMYNQEVLRDGSSVNTWHYSPVKYWPQDDAIKTAFFAYAPYTASSDIAPAASEAATAVTAVSANTDAGNPTTRYHVGTNVLGQQDLVFASTGDLTNKAKTVDLEFNHALSRVAFKVKGWEADDPNSIYGTGTTVTVNSIKLATKRKEATLDLGTGAWSDPDNSTAWRGYAITPAFGMVANAKSDDALEDNDLFQIQSGSTETMTLTAEDGYVMLLPEINPEDNDKYMLFVDYTVRTEDDALAGGFVEYRNNVYRFFTPHFEQGKAYAITIHLGMNGTPGADDGDYDEPFDPNDEPDNDPENPAHPAADVAEIAFTQTVIDWDSASDKNLNYTGDYAKPTNILSYTIRTTTANAVVSLPFVNGPCPAELEIDWGDSRTFASYTEITDENKSHTYAEPGDYTITIVSAEKDVTKQQVPEYKIGSSTNINTHFPKQLVSVNTPLLHSGQTSLKKLFCYLSGLTTIPAGLFNNCTEVTDFSGAFSNCSGLQSIPSGLFDNCTKVTNYGGLFEGCSVLQEIPAGLFDHCTEVTSFLHAFYGCFALQSIPTGLFDHCTKVTDFGAAFERCVGLQSIPEGLFDNCTEVEWFTYVFKECSGLTSISANLFDNCTKVKGFGSAFYYCSNITSDVPKLWDTTKWPNAVSKDYCFKGCTRAANYTSIPSGWK